MPFLRRTVLFAALVACGGLVGGLPRLVAADTPATGVVIIRATAQAQGSARMSLSSDQGSASQEESYAVSVTAETRYTLEDLGSSLVSGDELGFQANASVSGGGTLTTVDSEGHRQTSSWTFKPRPDFGQEAGACGGAYDWSPDSDLNYAGAGVDFPPHDYEVSPPTAGGPWGAAVDAAYEAFRKAQSVEFEVPTNRVNWSQTKTQSGQYSMTLPGLSAEGSASCTLTMEVQLPGQRRWEAIILPNLPGQPAGSSLYDQWLPEGGPDENTPGNSLPVLVKLRAVDGSTNDPPRAKFTFYLKDVSRQPGLCLNHPHRDQPASPEDTSPLDLKFHPLPEFTTSDDRQQTENDELDTESGALIECFDYGAYGKLKVVVQTEDGQTLVATVDGHPDQDYLSIPLDDNQNQVADAWEKDQGVFDRNLDAQWEGTLDSECAGQALAGDGLSLYEKYRGFYVLGAGDEPAHERLDPRLKYVFVYNPDHLVREVFRSADGWPESYPALSKCEVRYVAADGWTGPGAFGDQKRIVNFNSTPDKHVVDQHALYVTVNPSKNPFQPADLIALRNGLGLGVTAQPIDRSTEGCTYVDNTAPAAFGEHKRPASSYQVEIYAANVTNYLFDTVRYHSRGECAAPCDDAQLSALAQNYVASHAASFATKYTIELSATMAHEMGHGTGVKHHSPTGSDAHNPDLANCTMRYYSPNEFSANAGDRFELAARGHNPSFFCRDVFNCWGQLRVTDNPAAAPGAALAGGMSRRSARASRAGPTLPDEVATRLALSADLDWPDLVDGDPLRLWVRLHGTTSALAANWTDGLRLTLRRLPASGPAELVLGPEQWPAYLRPVTFDTTLLAIPNVTRLRELLVPPDAAGLSAGNYTLEIAWHGAAFAPAALLPADGVLTLPAIQFTVQAPTKASLQALGQRHLAWYAYLTDDQPGVLAHTREADRLDPDTADPLAIQAQLMRATAAARLGAPLEGAEVLDQLQRRLAPAGNHVAAVAGAQLRLLTPAVRVVDPPRAGQGARLEVSAFPGQTYVLQTSPDLATWTAISTNKPTGSTFQVLDPTPATGDRQYYRAVWLP